VTGPAPGRTYTETQNHYHCLLGMRTDSFGVHMCTALWSMFNKKYYRQVHRWQAAQCCYTSFPFSAVSSEVTTRITDQLGYEEGYCVCIIRSYGILVRVFVVMQHWPCCGGFSLTPNHQNTLAYLSVSSIVLLSLCRVLSMYCSTSVYNLADVTCLV
jgi:hypothetical protein